MPFLDDPQVWYNFTPQTENEKKVMAVIYKMYVASLTSGQPPPNILEAYKFMQRDN